jgi:hypothetical protein
MLSIQLKFYKELQEHGADEVIFQKKEVKNRLKYKIKCNFLLKKLIKREYGQYLVETPEPSYSISLV